MKPRAAKTRFLKRLEVAGLSLDALTPATGVEAMLAYYAEERADGCDIDEDGDMLLFQWGTHDWGDGPAFEVSIVRQLIVADVEEEEPRQLDLRFRFRASGRGFGRRCESVVRVAGRVGAFRRFVVGSAALKAVGKQAAESVELRYGRT